MHKVQGLGIGYVPNTEDRSCDQFRAAQHRIIAGPLGLEPQVPPQHPDQWVKPGRRGFSYPESSALDRIRRDGCRSLRAPPR